MFDSAQCVRKEVSNIFRSRQSKFREGVSRWAHGFAAFDESISRPRIRDGAPDHPKSPKLFLKAGDVFDQGKDPGANHAVVGQVPFKIRVIRLA